MASLKWTILFFLAVATAIFGSTGGELNNKDTAAEDFCETVCGQSSGVECYGDKTRKSTIVCNCTDFKKKFDYLNKECKENTEDFCEAVCGRNPGVICYGNTTKKDETMCACEDNNKVFDRFNKSCKDDKCLIKCGIPYNGENDKLSCRVSFGDVKCECKKWDMVFDSTDKTCKVSCKSDYECSGKSRCNAGKFCVCEDGYEGDNCNLVTGCKHLEEYCHAIGTECVFDKYAPKKATCECESRYVYDPKLNVCKASYCYPNNPCKEGVCVYDRLNDAGYCKCFEVFSYYNYKTQKCEDLPDKCLLRKYPCDENEVCVNGNCKCKYPKEPRESCKPRLCTPNPCFANAKCLDYNGKCYCEEGMYYDSKMCKYIGCNLHDFHKNCTCPPDTKRIKGGECKPDKHEEDCFKDCGYGVCIKNRNTENCKCFKDIAVASIGVRFIITCILDKRFCIGGRLQKNRMRCECEGQYTQADDGITCRLKTCDDIDAIKECASKGGECRMDWKGNGYYCQCAKGYEIGDNGICTDPCSIKKNIQACAVRDQICHNSFSPTNNNSITCRCPPTISMVDGKCYGKANYLYMIRDIPVLKKRYEMKIGFNKVLLNADLVISMEQSFSKDDFDYGYLYDFREEGDILNCSVWINLKNHFPFRQLRRINIGPKAFSNVRYWDNTVILWPPSLLVSEKGVKQIRIERLHFCSAEVKDLLCGKASMCGNNECSCAEGFKIAEYSFRNVGDYKIQRCEDIDECAMGIAMCSRNTTCVNTFGNYKCVCNYGFKKRGQIYNPETDKSDCYHLCSPSPCKKGKCSIRGETIDCNCELGYAGSFCDRFDFTLLNSEKLTVVVGCILGVPLVIIIIGFLSYKIAMRKRPVTGNFVPSAPPVDDTEMMETKPVQGEVNKADE